MDLQLKDRVVIVTGGARGIGAAISSAFAAEGARVAIVGRSPQDGESLAREISAAGGQAACFACELTDAADLERAVAAVRERFGPVAIVVNNAGVNDGVGLHSSVDDFRASLERNLIHPFALVRLCLPDLISTRGCIINIGTKCSDTGQGGTSGYAAAKGGLNALTREWALDLAPHGIRANAVIPAEVMTPQYERWISQRPDPAAALAAIESTIPLGGRMTTAREIADTVVFVASARASHTTGQILYVDGGYVHFDRAVTVKNASAASA